MEHRSIVRPQPQLKAKTIQCGGRYPARYRAGHDVLDRGPVRRRRVLGRGRRLQVPRRRVRRPGRRGRRRRDRHPGRRQRRLQGPGARAPRRRRDRVGGAACGCSRRTRARPPAGRHRRRRRRRRQPHRHACLDWAGSLTGDGYAIQGNILTGEDVVLAMQTAWETSDPDAPLARRLLAALTAGDAAGGDSRGRQSAALLVVKEGAGYGGLDDIAVDLRVDDHADPDPRAGPAARPQRPLPHRLDRGGAGPGHRRPRGRARGVRAGAGRPRLPGLGRHRELRDAGRPRPVLDRPAGPRHRPGHRLQGPRP